MSAQQAVSSPEKEEKNPKKPEIEVVAAVFGAGPSPEDAILGLRLAPGCTVRK